MSLDATYIMPIRRDAVAPDGDLLPYLERLAGLLSVIVVDGSPPEIFNAHHRRWGHLVQHVPPARQTLNGKVGGVLTGVALARSERLVLADDDVRYEPASLERVLALLDGADVVRPQNYFAPLPWHARWDTARSLLNRVTGGDWPGTLAVHRSALQRAGGYSGDVLFENLELVRTIRALGGREVVPLDLYVRRAPPSVQHFRSQRVRQAYDELARPLRLLVWLAVVPLLMLFGLKRRWDLMLMAAALTSSLAEWGRRRAGGRHVFPVSSTLLAPGWVIERGLCSWLALGARVVLGGVPYRGTVVRHAATPVAKLRRRYAGMVTA